MKDQTEHFSRVAHDLIEEGRDRKRRLRQRIEALGPLSIRGRQDRPFHPWIFYSRAKENHREACRRAAFIIAAFRELI